MKPYTELDGFENVYLEESYVLAIEARPGTVSFELEVVLTPEHPEYAPPPLGIFACYREGRLDFEGVTYLEWSGQGSPPISDPSGEPDYGQIDAFGWDYVHPRWRCRLSVGWLRILLGIVIIGS